MTTKAQQRGGLPGLQGISAVVTGGGGFVGLRLVEMLIISGAKRVVVFDIVAEPEYEVDKAKRDRIVYVQGDITK